MPRPTKGRDGSNLASQTIRVVMQYSAYIIRLSLCDVTPMEDEPTIHVKNHNSNERETQEERRDLIGLHARSPVDLGNSSSSNPCLVLSVWPQFFGMENPKPLPMMFGIYFQ